MSKVWSFAVLRSHDYYLTLARSSKRRIKELLSPSSSSSLPLRASGSGTSQAQKRGNLTERCRRQFKVAVMYGILGNAEKEARFWGEMNNTVTRMGGEGATREGAGVWGAVKMLGLAAGRQEAVAIVRTWWASMRGNRGRGVRWIRYWGLVEMARIMGGRGWREEEPIEACMEAEAHTHP
ncbi:hypothetical protein TrRE_jg626 [Triparma retinervis]|uniref:Uncharacterized protein n=1 Tax=Triparma retinervis TaxID=2557542 RepID=A0A9W7E1E6_9STRA|nr:hypothetical protein TrRE_jg626 [Triparma retinervis]